MMNFEFILTAEKKIIKQDITKSFQLGATEIRARPAWVGICGSDLYHYLTYNGPILRPGHEWIGEVIELGSSVKNISVGDTVTSSATLGCGHCPYCQVFKVNLCENSLQLGSDRLGAIRSELIFNSFNALKLKSSHYSEVLIEVMAVAEEAIHLMNIHKRNQDETILILGAGAVGILIACALRAEGKKVIIVDINPMRVKRAQKFKFEAFLLKHLLMLPKYQHSFDILFDATADRDQNKGGFNYLSYFGRKKFLGIIIGKYTKNVELSPDTFARAASQLVFMRGVPLDTFQMTIQKWSGNLEPIAEGLISHIFKTSELADAYHTALDTGLAGKVIIDMSH